MQLLDHSTFCEKKSKIRIKQLEDKYETSINIRIGTIVCDPADICPDLHLRLGQPSDESRLWKWRDGELRVRRLGQPNVKESDGRREREY